MVPITPRSLDTGGPKAGRAFGSLVQGPDTPMQYRIKDLAMIRGSRSNQLTGVGVIVGLDGTGDSKSTPQTMQAISNTLRRFGLNVDSTAMTLKNVAIVLVTAELPAFIRPGQKIDVVISSMGDAKSLQGGTLLQTPMYGAANTQDAYAVAAGPISIGGFNFGAGGTSIQKNHVTAGRIPEGAIVERAVETTLMRDKTLYVQLNMPDPTTANNIAGAISLNLTGFKAMAVDPGTVKVDVDQAIAADPVSAIAALEALQVKADVLAKIVVNERTGTVVIGENVKLRPAAIAHGGITVTITKTNSVSQPPPFTENGGQGVPFSNTSVDVEEPKTHIAYVGEMPTVSDLVKALNQLGVTPRDLISILQALRSAGALQAQIEVQ